MPAAEPIGDASAARPLRVLIVRTSAMGDVLHALPAVAAMRRLHPDWYIGWVIDPRWQPLLQADGGADVPTGSPARPIVDCVHAVPTQEWKRHPFTLATVRGVAALGKELRAAKYDLCVDMQGLMRSSLVGRMSGTPRYVGRKSPRERVARWLYKLRVTTHSPHVIDQGCELLGAAIGSPLTACEVKLPVDAAAEIWADDFLSRTLPRDLWHRFALFAPTAGWGAKQWPHERYGRVAIALAEAGYATLVNAYKADDAAATAVVTASLGCAVVAPATMPQMISLQRRAALVIAGDTGPLHLAAALGRPVVGLYGPTDPNRTGPYTGPCSGKSRVLRHTSSIVDHSRHERSEAGLLQITVEEVVAAALDLLRGSEPKEASERAGHEEKSHHMADDRTPHTGAARLRLRRCLPLAGAAYMGLDARQPAAGASRPLAARLCGGIRSQERRADHDRPYAYTRNPLYLGSMAIAFGFAAASGRWIIVVVLTALFLAIYLPTILSEEEFLRAHFSGFDAYAAKVPRLLPRLTPAATTGTAGSFSKPLYLHHREYNAAMGAAAIYAALAARLWFLAAS